MLLFHTKPINTSYISRVLTYYRDMTKSLELQDEESMAPPTLHRLEDGRQLIKQVDIACFKSLPVRWQLVASFLSLAVSAALYHSAPCWRWRVMGFRTIENLVMTD